MASMDKTWDLKIFKLSENLCFETICIVLQSLPKSRLFDIEKKIRNFFFQNSLNLRINAIFEIFKKNKRKLMCYTYSNTLIFEVFDDNLAVTDEKWQVCFGQFCLSWCLFSFHCPYRHGVCDLKFSYGGGYQNCLLESLVLPASQCCKSVHFYKGFWLILL